MGGAVRCAALALLSALLIATPASAANVSTRTVCEFYGKGCSDVTHVSYRAAPGERNALRVRWRKGTVTFTDRVPISAPRKCKRAAPTEVTCSGDVIEATLGDGDDSATATNVNSGPFYRGSILVDGGDGNDRLSGTAVRLDGGSGNDWLAGNQINGGDGDDLLVGTDAGDLITGGAGADEIHGGLGDDDLNGDGGPAGTETGTDLIDGGPGSDTVSYATRRTPVEVDLQAHVGGGTGERDELESIENATGGAGADKLVGDEASNRLDGGTDCPYEMLGGAGDLIHGGAGDDFIRGGCNPNRLYGDEGEDRIGGGGSSDLLDGGPGNDSLGGIFGGDRYIGGDGNDDLLLSGEGGEDVSCGNGLDHVSDGSFAVLPPDCETVDGVFTRAAAYPSRPTTSELRLEIHCRVAGRLCKASVRLKLLGRRNAFARGQFSAKDGVLRPRLRIPQYMAASKRSPLPVRVIVEGTQRQQGSDDFEIQWVFDLSAAPVDRGAATSA